MTTSSATAVATPVAPAISDHGAYTNHLTEGQRLFDETRDDSSMDPLSWVVRVSKSHHELSVYYKQRRFKTYQAVFGRSRWAGSKQWEGDLRTPEGNYLIVDRHPSQRFRWFLTLNYPNAIDLAKFQELRSAHEIPVQTRAGGRVGIHGTDEPMLNEGGVNWTTGCISVDNADISELAELLPIGTLVIINP
jgi:murein L,D-transpeptidase YafK